MVCIKLKRLINNHTDANTTNDLLSLSVSQLRKVTVHCCCSSVSCSKYNASVDLQRRALEHDQLLTNTPTTNLSMYGSSLVTPDSDCISSLRMLGTFFRFRFVVLPLHHPRRATASIRSSNSIKFRLTLSCIAYHHCVCVATRRNYLLLG